jgi:hypothetical protein
MFYIEVQDRYYKVKDYKQAVTVLANFSFSERSKSNKQYRDSVAARFVEVTGFNVVDTSSDRKFIDSLVSIGELKISKTKPKKEERKPPYNKKRK